ncbi:DUF448 domain-containing protein [Oecophyllibacter saccharovorans]|uniref:DUF448 domain-containing protein n=1 Tax=Oecophyllibacter saccharovorans TaxID=2558360 RepID=UPI0038D05893
MVTRQQEAPERMLRLVIGPGGEAVVDLAARLPGRGMWLAARREVVEAPKLAQSMARAMRREVKLPEDFAKLVCEGLARRVQDGISLARRAGEAVSGFQKCRDMITGGRAGLLLCAEGASQDELARLLSGHRDLPVMRVPERFLAVAFGRGRAVYAVVAPGALARRLKTECERFWGVAEGALPDPAVRPARVS